MAAQISTPYIVIIYYRDGTVELLAGSEPKKESFQLKSLIFHRFTNISIVSADGLRANNVILDKEGIDYEAYKQFGLFGVIAFFVSLLLLSILVRCRLRIQDVVEADYNSLANELSSCLEEGRLKTAIPDNELASLLKRSNRISEFVIEVIRRQ